MDSYLKQTLSIPQFKGKTWRDTAMRIGVGITNIEMYAAAGKVDYRAVGGSCPTIGVGGGFTQSGGHGPLGAKYGLGADQALEYEVVTADGTHTTASPSRNSDLYWAIAGGRAGNYAVLLSVTVKVFQDGPIAGGGFSFVNTGDNYWKAISAWLEYLLTLNELHDFGTFWAFTALGFQLQYAAT